MNVRKYFPVFLLCCLACTHKKQEISGEKFDKAKWITQSGKEYPYRDLMLNDLIANKRLTGLKRDSILNMLGQPNRSDTNYIFYSIEQTLLAGIFPVHTTMLVVEFAADSTVRSSKIYQ